MSKRALLRPLRWRSPLRLTKRQGALFLGCHLCIAFLVVCPFLPGPNGWSSETNSVFTFCQVLSLPSLLLVPVGLLWTSRQLRASSPTTSPLYALLLWTLPLMVCGHCGGSAPWLREVSRRRAIDQSAPLLRALDAYRAEHEQYPVLLDDLLPRYLPQLPSPRIMGIAAYGYARHAGCFEISFAQNVLLGFNYEVVVYDPNTHQRAEGKLATLYPAGVPHWQYYVYD
ncbi:hypothetical protein [Hymenobacter volaticus]|uniref:Uncharacterized protein n=1 Tax=Hymenobacter volaticus TaxID=2932254 RepID=A0ABY4GEA5_9BACT|nr:hypothetical protein [Hymenobacter volaticus]UOQ69182.1 hypothetical protein MUN86_26065 [Hymenobacter volaticus]